MNMRISGVAGLLFVLPLPGLPGQTLFLVPGQAPSLKMPAGAKPLDCRPFGAVAFHVKSAAGRPVVLRFEVRDAAGAMTKGTFRVQAPADFPVALPLNSPDPLEMGMRGPAAIPGYRLASSDYHKIDISRVSAILLNFPEAALVSAIAIDDVKLIPGITYDQIVDPLGQFARGAWPGKIKSAAEFRERRAAEEAAIAAHPRLPDRDAYGGWSAGPTLASTGFFRAAKRDGKWWLVTPGGHLFLSFGANSINTTEGDTITEGRERMFQWLPAKDDPLAGHYSENRDWAALGLKIKHNLGRSFNFYSANLERKYGRNWRAAWEAATLARLPAWGMNTIGNWSDPQLYGARKIAYTVTIDPWPAVKDDQKTQFAEVASGNDYWKRMADPFDPRYAAALDRGMREQALAHRDDPWCLGYFVDNEMSWGSMQDDRSRYGLALGALALEAGSPAKQAFVKSLKAKHGDITRLNLAWGTTLASWQALLDRPLQPAGELSAGIKDDLRAFSRDFARQYFRTVIGILKKYDPNHLYLGPRFAWHTRESVEACGELCDVVSFNIYRPKVVPSEWNVLDGIDKPVLIGEFHMGALDRGMFHTGLVPAEDQADRARMYREYIRSVVDHPLMVGCHYFKYADEPLTGRPGDGENYNIGLVSVTDTPYPELIEAARAVHAEAYQRRAAVAAAAAPKPGRFTIDTERGAFLVDGKPFQIVSGEMHYLRIPPEYWRDRLLMARAMGLNTVTTYVFWNMHEPRPGMFDFSGNADLARFVKTAREVGLYVIIRPGPYACAEWEFGGYPAWLLKAHDLVVRSMDERYLKASERYIQRLGQELAPLQNTRGGPIVMVQFENEYGSYGKDKAYLRRVRDMLRQAGFDVPLFTSDGATQMPDGYLPEALPAINGSVDQEIFDTIRKFRPHGPFFVAEFYPGWLDHWGEPHAHVDAAKSAGELEWMLSHGVSVNLYMFHGGTSFGFMNGANYSDHYQPQPTSYDYDAPLDEAGRPTPKYYKFRDAIAKHLPAGVGLWDVPQTRPTIEIPRFDLDQSAGLFDSLPSPVKSAQPLSMEDLGQSYGYILYRTRITAPVAGRLTITELRDYAVVMLNGRRIGSLDRRHKQDSVDLSVPRAPAVLDILVENGGRINYGRLLTDNRKGITEKVTLAGKELAQWEIYPLPMVDMAATRFNKRESPAGPLLRRGAFQVDAPGDTFLDMRGWGKGCVLVNGHNLGRFWHIGPQQTLYLPGVWLRKGANQIVVLDLEPRSQSSVAGIGDPILNQLEPE